MRNRIAICMTMWLCSICSLGQDIPYSDYIYGGSANGIVGKINDEFNVTPNGQVSYEIPIPTVAGTGGMAPKLSIVYNSSTKDGLFGYGFDLAGLSMISRAPRNVHDDGIAGYVSFGSNDRFLLDGNRLVLERVISSTRYEYRTQNNTYDKIISNGSRYNPNTFTVKTKSGLTYEYKSSKLILNDTTSAKPVFWLVTKVSDTKGNYFTIVYSGDAATNDIYPTRINYTGNSNASLSPYASVRFYYTNNSFAPTTYIYGQPVRRQKVVSSLRIYYGSTIIRKLTALYRTDHHKRQLAQLTEIATDGTKKNPTLFNWYNTSNNSVNWVSHSQNSVTQLIDHVTLVVGDYNGDGISEYFTFPYTSSSSKNADDLSSAEEKDSLALDKDSLSASLTYTIPDSLSYNLEDSLRTETEADTLNHDTTRSGSLLFHLFSQYNKILTVNDYTTGTLLQAASGDYNGDGRDDFVTVCKESGQYKCYLFLSYVTSSGLAFFKQPVIHTSSQKYSVHTVEVNGDGAADLFIQYANSKNYAVIRSSYDGTTLTPLSSTVTGTAAEKWDRVEFVDFNGDGLTDVMNLTSNGYKLLKSNGQGSLISGGTAVWPQKEHHLYLGDLNGDGKTDMLLTGWDNNPNPGGWSEWIIQFSKGDGTFQSLDIARQFQSDDRRIFLVDINGDGFDDYYAIDKTSSGGAPVTPHVYLNDGTGITYAQGTSSSVAPLDRANYYLGDFNGDGRMDILNTSNWTTTTTKGCDIYLASTGPNYLLSSITDGLGNTTEISYLNLTNTSIHTRGNTASYPVSSCCPTWPAVYQVKAPNGLGGQRTTTYSYENALMHKRGRGLLGFEKFTAYDEDTETATVTKMEYDPDQFLTAVSYTETQVCGQSVSKTYITNSLDTQVTGSGGSIYSFRPVNTDERTYDYGTGNTLTRVQTTTQYDSYGNVTGSTTENTGTETVTTTNTYSDDTTNWLLGRLTSSIVEKSISGYTSTRTTQFEYDSNSGLLTAEYIEPDNAKGTKKTYQHDAYGNITQSTTEAVGGGVTPRTTRSTYDVNGRFVTSQTDALGFTTTNTIDQTRGLLLSSTDENGIITTNTYDSFGRNVQSCTPIDTVQTVTGWSAGMTDAPANALYFQYVKATGQPFVLEFYDCLGRTIRKVTESHGGQKIYADVVYNGKGLVLKTSEPYFPGETVYWNTNEYDDMGRLVRQTAPDGSYYQMTYDGLTTTTRDPNGHYTTREMNVMGNLKKVTDALGSTVTYYYNADGHCTQITAPKEILRMTYDVFGNKLTQTDYATGTTTYTYNAFGEVTEMQQEPDLTVSYEYDNGGRVICETRPDMTITTTYDTRFNGAVTRIQSSNGHSIDYYYDAYGRVTKEKEVIGTKTFNTLTTYNTLGKTDVVTYPSNFKIKNIYSDNGILVQVKNASSSTIYWTLNSLNARGQIESEHLGSGLDILTSYNVQKGWTSRIRTSNSALDWRYQYDGAGNMTSRSDVNRNLSEAFIYDALDRVTNVLHNGQWYQTISYDEAGNILSKTGVGTNFTYFSHGNRLRYFDSSGYQPVVWDQILYSSFNKITHVSKGSDQLDITYGALKSRIMAVQTSGSTTETRYYVGKLYEENIKNDVVTKINYIFAGGRAIAIYRKVVGGSSVLRYIHHDPLGSVIAYSNSNGSIVQELSYDAWGRRRKAATWEYYNDIVDAHAWNAFGFTGHEHLDLFEMVDMDGRMYDPVIGRFLSPDPFIQAPDHTQSFNRYAYCLNNPLSLVDPSGYSWFSRNWKSLVASAVGIAASIVTAGGASGLAVAVVAGAVGGAAGALTGALLNGANIGQIAKSTFTGAFWGAVGGLANFASADTDMIAQLFKHAFTEGIQEGLQGGNIAHGMMMGALSSASGSLISSYQGSLKSVGCVAVNAVISGTISEIGGGKFANGAVTGAFSILFNDMMHRHIWDRNLKSIFYHYHDMAKIFNEDPIGFYLSLGGPLAEWASKACLTGSFDNTCAAKLSYALNNSGFPIASNAKGAYKGADNQYYIIRAEHMKAYLDNTFTGKDLPKNWVVKNAIVSIQLPSSPSVSGHIDVIYRGESASSHYFEGETKYYR